MSVNQLDPNPTITIIFKGASVTRIHDGERLAQVGAIAGDACHAAKIKVFRLRNGQIEDENKPFFAPDDFNRDDDLFLDVEGTSRRDVQTYQKDNFNRAAESQSPGPDQQEDFRYLIDLRRDILKDTPFLIDQSKLKPIFHIPRAVFYTHLLTEFPVRVKPLGSGGGATSDLGFAAEEIAARITLDQPNSRAVLRNGSKVMLTVDHTDVQRGTSYQIVFDCLCEEGAAAANPTSDFTLLYQAIKSPNGDLPEERKRDLELTPPAGAVGVSPLVFCGQGNGG